MCFLIVTQNLSEEERQERQFGLSDLGDWAPLPQEMPVPVPTPDPQQDVPPTPSTATLGFQSCDLQLDPVSQLRTETRSIFPLGRGARSLVRVTRVSAALVVGMGALPSLGFALTGGYFVSCLQQENAVLGKYQDFEVLTPTDWMGTHSLPCS